MAGRLPDPVGLAHWVDLVYSGAMTFDQVADAFAASNEFQTLTKGMTNGQLVDFMYQNTLDRGADPAGYAHWKQLLDNGMDRGDLLLGFSQSEEHFNMMASHITNGIDYLI